MWLGSWSHLLFDSIETGVMWLWPLSTKQFALSKGGENIDTVSSPKWTDLFRGYFKLVTCYIEIFVTVIALTLLILS